ncbi:MAG: hypothetical protein U1C73_20655, partial [Dietzia sp.]|nr:hypothetical protein [Dietzia sp.]
ERGGGPLQVEPVEEPVVGPSGGRGEDRVECDLSSVGQADAGQTSVLGQDAGDGRLFEPDTAGPPPTTIASQCSGDFSVMFMGPVDAWCA